MSDIADKPDWAPSIWKDNRGKLYAQFGQDVLRFDLTQDGLGKLIKLIPAIEGQPGYVSGGQNIADETIARKTTSKPKMSRKLDRQKVLKTLTPERRAKLQEMIRKANIKEKEK